MPHKGYIKTEEHRLHLSQACKGRIAPNKGIPCSNEQKAKISKTLMGHISWNKGVPMAIEQKEKMKLAMMGQKRPKSEIQKIRLRNSLLKLWQQDDFRVKMCTPDIKARQRKGALNSMKSLKNKRFCNTKPELEMSSIFDELNIVYIHPYFIDTIEHCYPADFYLPDQNIIIEVDGKHWHNYPSGTEIDRIRTKELLEKNFKVIRFWENEFNKEQVILKLRGA